MKRKEGGEMGEERDSKRAKVDPLGEGVTSSETIMSYGSSSTSKCVSFTLEKPVRSHSLLPHISLEILTT